MTNLFLFAWFLSSFASGQAPAQAVDILDEGLLVNGAVTFQNDSANTTFVIHGSDVLVGLKVNSDVAFSSTRNDSIAYEWSQFLARTDHATIRIADIRHLADDRSEQRGILECIGPKPQERTSTDAAFELSCLPWDEQRWRRNSAGRVVPDFVVVISVKNNSAADQYLGKQRDDKVIFVRLENMPTQK